MPGAKTPEPLRTFVPGPRITPSAPLLASCSAVASSSLARLTG
jgi:hypothetical protein